MRPAGAMQDAPRAEAWPALGADETVSQATTMTLADGRRVRVRPVAPRDAVAEQAFIAALTPQTRRRRFHGALKQLPAPMLRAMTAVDFHGHVAVVAEAICDDGDLQLVADARYVRHADGSAEFALVVADAWQGRGLGRALMRGLARHARAHGVKLLRGTVLADNVPMLTLVQALGASLHADPDDATLVQARFSP